MKKKIPTIKRMEKGFERKWYGGGFSPVEHKFAEKEPIKSFFHSYLSEVLEYLKQGTNEIVNQKFPRGERKWCVECAQRIRKDLLNKIKKLKGEE